MSRHPFFDALIKGEEEKYAEENPDAFYSGYAEFHPSLLDQPASVLARGVAVAYPKLQTLPGTVAMGYMIEWCYGNRDNLYNRFTQAIDALKEHAPGSERAFSARFSPSTVAGWIKDETITKEYALYARNSLDAEISYSPSRWDLVEARDELLKRFGLEKRNPRAIPAIFETFG